jgi:sugar phosphate isomerase/epimerase
MKISQVAAQLYSVRDFLKTPADIAKSLRRIRKIGYEAVQLSGLGPIDDAELSRILSSEGLIACSAHEPGKTIIEEPERVVEKLSRLSCPSVAYPFPSGIPMSTLAQVKTFARALNKSGAVFQKNKKIFAYHNHNIEFMKVGGRPILEIIYEETDPNNVQAEIDTYWVQAGGANPEAWCARLKKRLPILHLKDYGVNEDRQPVFREIGYGNLDFPAIISAAEKSGCKWFIVEQDANWMKNDPFKSLKASFDYIQENLVKA